MSSLLEAKALCKCFGENKETKVTILNHINLKVEAGEFVAIMGQSGSGKSTLLYNISGMDQMTSGEVLFDGQVLSSMTEDQMAQLRLNKMGFIFQHAYLLKNISIEDNILLPGYKADKQSKEKVLKKTKELMKKLGIELIADHDITKVSGGQLQRAAIARALINDPKILFGDEPTGALNSSTTSVVMDIINGINKEGTAVLLVTHDAKVAARADRVIFLSDGHIEAECLLGKYNEGQGKLKVREDKLTAFLEDKGF